VTESRSDVATTPDPEAGEEPGAEAEAAALEEWAASLTTAVGATDHSTEHGTVRVYVAADRWRDTLEKARDDHGLVFFSWLTGVDWSKDVEVGDPVQNPDELEERIEVMCRLSSIESPRGAHFIATLSPEAPSIASVVPLFGGAAWHEREAAEMFGIDFVGHPGLDHLYLPDAFEGHPLRKSFPLLSRRVKPWPGTVDVEAMPSAENVEAQAMADAQADAGDTGEATGEEDPA